MTQESNKGVKTNTDKTETEVKYESEKVTQPEITTDSTKNANSIAIPIAIVVAGLLIAGSVLFTNERQTAALVAQQKVAAQNQQAQGAQQQPQAPAVDVKNVTIAGEPFIGNPNAPVTIAYWYDYQCPFCQRHEQQVMTLMVKDYVDTGKAKIVFKDYAFLGEDSISVALIERAVWEVAPDKFYAWHKMIFDNQGSENGGWAKKANILKLSKTIPGLDVAKVEALTISKEKEFKDGMQADQSEGSMYGVTGTPAFITGKHLVMGAQPYAQIKAAIDAALAEK